jgi:hypothetical protein
LLRPTTTGQSGVSRNWYWDWASCLRSGEDQTVSSGPDRKVILPPELGPSSRPSG